MVFVNYISTISLLILRVVPQVVRMVGRSRVFIYNMVFVNYQVLIDLRYVYVLIHSLS